MKDVGDFFLKKLKNCMYSMVQLYIYIYIQKRVVALKNPRYERKPAYQGVNNGGFWMLILLFNFFHFLYLYLLFSNKMK